jgi:sec-independent protein translocase protein TatB
LFDLGWSKLIIIAMLAIVVVGPKELPALLRAIGKFVGQIRRQADEFRRQFDEAMKDTELDQIRKDVEDIKRTATDSMHDIERSAQDSVKPLETAASDITHLGNGTAPETGGSHGAFAAELPPIPAAAPALPTTPPGVLTKTGA